jgi:WD40 repeat protein
MLLGHSGPVYGLSFSPDRTMMLSCSEDGTIRLWSLQTWTCLVIYKVFKKFRMGILQALHIFRIKICFLLRVICEQSGK